jgi:hypothetical protein
VCHPAEAEEFVSDYVIDDDIRAEARDVLSVSVGEVVSVDIVEFRDGAPMSASPADNDRDRPITPELE